MSTSAAAIHRAAFARHSSGGGAAFFRAAGRSPVQQGVSRGGGNCVRSYRGAFGNSVQQGGGCLHSRANEFPVHSRQGVQRARGAADVFVLPQAFNKVRRWYCFARNAAPPVNCRSPFRRLAVRAIAILSPPSDIALQQRRAAKSAFRVLRHLQESGAFAGARRKSGAPCCAVRRFPPRRRYISHPNSRTGAPCRAAYFSHIGNTIRSSGRFRRPCSHP